MDSARKSQIRQAIADINARFCHYLDSGEFDALIELFTEDVYYTHALRESRGRDALAKIFAGRKAQGPRTSRHVQSSLLIDIISPTRATGRSYCVVYASPGEPPHRSTAPAVVADFMDVYILEEDGHWRFAERHVRRIFDQTQS